MVPLTSMSCRSSKGRSLPPAAGSWRPAGRSGVPIVAWARCRSSSRCAPLSSTGPATFTWSRTRSPVTVTCRAIDLRDGGIPKGDEVQVCLGEPDRGVERAVLEPESALGLREPQVEFPLDFELPADPTWWMWPGVGSERSNSRISQAWMTRLVPGLLPSGPPWPPSAPSANLCSRPLGCRSSVSPTANAARSRWSAWDAAGYAAALEVMMPALFSYWQMAWSQFYVDPYPLRARLAQGHLALSRLLSDD